MKKTSLHKNSLSLAVLPVLLLAVLALAGCQSTQNPQPLPHSRLIDPPETTGMLSANTYAGDAIANILLKRMSSGRSILTASLVEMDKMEQSSPFGRFAMQQIGSRVAQHGFKVVDVHLMEAMIINNNGDFMLSRDICKILADKYDAYAVILGVYAHAGDKLYVSVRALRLSDATVLAAYEYYLPANADSSYLLTDGGAYGSGQSAHTWNTYAARGQSFANCSQSAVASAGTAVKRTPPAKQAAPRKATTTKKPASTKRTPRRAAAAPRKAPAPAPAPAPVAPRPAYSQDCPQDIPSNRRLNPDDICGRNVAPYYR